MLYDIMPPVVFFGSLGGIILVISRVVTRLKRQEFSAAIQTEGAQSREAHQLLHPGESKVKLVKSRLTAAITTAKQSLQKVRQPHSSWRHRLGRLASALGETLGRARGTLFTRLAQLREKSKTAAPLPPPLPPKTPTVSLRRVESAPSEITASRLETTTARLQALVRKSRATTSPVQAAQQAIATGKLEQAEDILVPYIVKHPKNTIAYLLLSEIARVRHNWNEALEILEQVIRLDAATPGAFAKLGEAALHSGHMTRALEALQRAHDAEPQDVSVMKNLLTIADRMDNRVLQKSIIQKLIVAAPDDPAVHLAAENLETRQHEREQAPAA